MGCTLMIRPHPKDNKWESRFRDALDFDHVVIEPSEWGRLEHLSDLMRHADVVVASQGSITMDAVAQDTCVINVCFDGDLDVPENESVRQWYLMDHYRSVMETGGVWLVNDFEELDEALIAYLERPEIKAAERERLREIQLEPMDGSASKRIASAITRLSERGATTSVSSVLDSAVRA
jgi:hypothetical protein